MGKIYYVMGKSASGKDTIFKKLLAECPKMRKIVLYTTRPQREGETDGVEYRFSTESELDRFEAEGKLIERRVYQTVYGPWTYATIDDGQILLGCRNYIAIGTLESYQKMCEYFGTEKIKPILIWLDDGIRLQRALNRENVQAEPHYREMCRRFLADEEDFAEEKIAAAGITRRYINEDLNKCFNEILQDIEDAKN